MDNLQRWVGVGRSADRDPHRAGASAVAAAVQGDAPKLLLVFASEQYDAPALLAAIGDAAGRDVPLIGCSTTGEITTGHAGDGGVVCVALGGPGFTAATDMVTDAGADLREAGANAATCLGDVVDQPHRVLVLLTDGLAGEQQEVVRGAYSVAGAGVPLVGGCVGDDRVARLFHGGEALRDGVLAAAIGSDAPFGVGVRHGWRPMGEAMLVTRSEGRTVVTIDDRPALDVYLDHLDAPAAARTDAEAFTRFALTHPLGLNRRGGEEHVRLVRAADFERRTIECVAEVPQGGLAWVMDGDDVSVMAATDGACADALAPLGHGDPLGLIVFDCLARRQVLGEGVGEEVARVATHAGDAPVAGFYTYGEIARTRGVTGYHNQTLVVLAIG